MSEMSERVTKAIRDELINIGYGVGTINAGQLSDALFRVAIEAMREPTQDMLESGLMAGTNLTTGQPSARLAARTAGERMADQWRAMIDAILAKTPA